MFEKLIYYFHELFRRTTKIDPPPSSGAHQAPRRGRPRSPSALIKRRGGGGRVSRPTWGRVCLPRNKELSAALNLCWVAGPCPR